jgi:hypothetical protein
LKFKFLFLFFNILIVFFLLIIVFMPVMILGGELSSEWNREFWASLWPLLAILAAALIVLDGYYFSNRRLFLLLEREDWPALSGYLEMRVLRKGHYSRNLVRILATTYLVLSDSAAVMGLENKLTLIKPALVRQNALLFGIGRILAKDYPGALRFFAAFVPGDTAPPRAFPDKQEPWLRWYHSFSLLLERRFEEAAEKFRLLAADTHDPLVAGLAAWFLADNLSQLTGGAASLEEAHAARERIRASLKTRRDWDREWAKTETEVYAAILRKYIYDTGNWIYGGV